MPVPWDAVLPCGIILGFFTILGQAQYQGARFANEGKVRRSLLSPSGMHTVLDTHD